MNEDKEKWKAETTRRFMEWLDKPLDTFDKAEEMSVILEDYNEAHGIDTPTILQPTQAARAKYGSSHG